MKKKILFFAIVCSIFLLAQAETKPTGAQGPGVRGPFIGPPVRAISFDGDVRKLPQAKPLPNRERPRPLRPGKVTAPQSNAPFRDPAVQTTKAPLVMPTPMANFKGLDFLNWGDGYPPDTNGDVGPSHYIQTVNTSIGIFSKTGTQLAAFSFDSFFTGAVSPCNSNQGDPVVLYDAMADRWLISDFAWTNLVNGPYYECFAVSKTSDPVFGGWWLYTFQTDASFMADYPKIGVWPNAYYMSANMFDILNGAGNASYQGVRVWAFDRVSMFSGTLNSVYFDVSSSYFSLLPSNLRGTSQPPSGSPNFFTSIDSAFGTLTTLYLFNFTLTGSWPTPAATFTGPTNLTVASFTERFADIPEDGGNSLDSLGDRLMMQLQYRNMNGTESLWANHTVNSGGVTGIRWYEIRNPNGSPTIYQQGTFQPDSNYRWMGSLAVDRNGNMAVGYSVSSSGMFPAIRYAGRLSTDTLDTLGQGEASLIEGTGAQTITNRWGDYSAMTIDPSDDCTFWYTNEYYETSGGNWQTRIGSFRFPSSGSNPTKLGPTSRPNVPIAAFIYYFPLVFKAGPAC